MLKIFNKKGEVKDPDCRIVYQGYGDVFVVVPNKGLSLWKKPKAFYTTEAMLDFMKTYEGDLYTTDPYVRELLVQAGRSVIC